MAKMITTKYGTKINVEGLTPEQVKRVTSTAQDNGAYGAKGAALAQSIQKRNAKGGGKVSIPGGEMGNGGNYDLGINPKTGAINPKTAVGTVTGAERDDVNQTFNMMNPGSQTDAFGNSQDITRDPVTGQVSINQKGGAGLSAVNQAFTNSALDFGANGKSAATAASDANYNYITKDYAKNKSQEMEAAKQELANRGIPLSADPNSLYAKTLQNIDTKYQGLDDQAKNQAITQGNQTLQTQAGVLGTLGQTAQGMGPNSFTAFQGGQSNQSQTLQNLLGTISSADLQKYGIGQDVMVKLRAIAAQRSGGGGGGGGQDTGPLFAGSVTQ